MKQAYQWPDATPPVAEKKDHETGMHGDKRNDEYYWMGDFFREGPDSDKVVEYLKAENAYTDTMMAGTAKFQEALFLEMKGRIKEKDESVPVFSNGYWYYTRSEEGEQYFKYCRKKGSLEAPEEILLDVDKMAEGHPYYSAVGFNVSPDNKLLAYGVDTVSRRQYTLYIKNLETGEHFADKIYPASGGSEWGNDNKTLFYTATNPKTLLSEKIKRHTLGTDPKKDVVVYNEKDKSNYIGVGKTKSDKYIVIASSATMSSEYLILDADKPEGKFEVFQPRMKDVLYDVDHQGDKFLIVTNKDALNFRLMETPVNATGVENWTEVIPNRADVLLEGIDVFKNHLVITERKNGLLQLRIRNINTNAEHYVDFGEPAYTAYAGSNPEYNSSNLRYIYTSLTTPSSVYDYDMETRDKELKKRQEVVGGYNPEEYVTERLYATVRDGVKVPISVVYKKGTPKSAGTPLLLYAYGSYGNSMDAAFSSTRLSLLNRGFIYALAHVRGGQEMGRQWYEDGKMFKKKNTFNDFIDCAEYLIKENYTSKEHLFAEGGSAGGLLMGAISNMRPDLWRGIIADVPFVDVVTTMLDESIPLTTNEFDEWGNPKNKDAYDYMKSYSPYDNVEKKAYPNMLITTGLHDSQVQYFEPAKWVARLRTHKTDNNVLLLKTNMEAGHGGASGRFDYLKEIALQFAFMFALEGISE
ncbi:S9 family peptidase [Dyadobacter sp. BHUBP1]|uniref:S9 family peptidase n=1 Tax=Dyadobacter sp. BHUBP1 TaxID=3424178 RepID=UPI003D343DBE